MFESCVDCENCWRAFESYKRSRESVLKKRDTPAGKTNGPKKCEFTEFSFFQMASAQKSMLREWLVIKYKVRKVIFVYLTDSSLDNKAFQTISPYSFPFRHIYVLFLYCSSNSIQKLRLWPIFCLQNMFFLKI